MPERLKAMQTSKIILESPNAKDLSLADLEELAGDLHEVIGSAGRSDLAIVAVACEPIGVANHLTDTLHCFLPSGDFLKDEMYTLVTIRIVAFMRKRFSRPHEGGRPREVILYDAEGKPLRRIEQNTAESEPSDGEPRVLTVRHVTGRGKHS